MHIIYRFVKSSNNMHQCLRCILGHLQWSQSLHITSANLHLAVIKLHTKCQLFSLSVSRDNWSWLQHFISRLNRFNQNWANPPIWSCKQTKRVHGHTNKVGEYTIVQTKQESTQLYKQSGRVHGNTNKGEEYMVIQTKQESTRSYKQRGRVHGHTNKEYMVMQTKQERTGSYKQSWRVHKHTNKARKSSVIQPKQEITRSYKQIKKVHGNATKRESKQS